MHANTYSRPKPSMKTEQLKAYSIGSQPSYSGVVRHQTLNCRRVSKIWTLYSRQCSFSTASGNMRSASKHSKESIPRRLYLSMQYHQQDSVRDALSWHTNFFCAPVTPNLPRGGPHLPTSRLLGFTNTGSMM
mgnify:CR=1 FL=1